MIKLLLKVAIAAFVVNAAIRVGAEYLEHVQFRDSARQAVTRADSDEEVHQSVVDVASAYGVPLEADSVIVEREARTVHVEGSYVKPILLLPGMSYPWRFNWEIDVYEPDDAGYESAR